MSDHDPGGGPPLDDQVEIYTDRYVLDELERLSMHTCDQLQMRIQEVFMWLHEQRRK